MDISGLRRYTRQAVNNLVALILWAAIAGFLAVGGWMLVGLLSNDQYPLFRLPSGAWERDLYLYLRVGFWVLCGAAIHVALLAASYLLLTCGTPHRDGARHRRAPRSVQMALLTMAGAWHAAAGIWLSGIELGDHNLLDGSTASMPARVGLGIALLMAGIACCTASRASEPLMNFRAEERVT